MEEKLEDMTTESLKLEYQRRLDAFLDANEELDEVEDELKARGIPFDDRNDGGGLPDEDDGPQLRRPDKSKKIKVDPETVAPLIRPDFAAHNPDKKCDCLFCVAKCPECGSANIDVRYAPEFRLRNSNPDKIFIDFESVRHMALVCHACDYEIDFDEDEDDRSIHGIQRAIFKMLGLAGNFIFERDEDGEITGSMVISEHKKRIE